MDPIHTLMLSTAITSTIFGGLMGAWITAEIYRRKIKNVTQNKTKIR